MGDYLFPSVGVKGDRLFAVGECEVCGLALVHDEAGGPPKAKTYCAMHDPKFAPPVRPKPISKKTLGEVLLEQVCARNKDRNGVGSIKMPADARADLINEINAAISGQQSLSSV